MSKPKILVFSTIRPFPIDQGDRIRLYQMLSQLTEIAHVRLLYVDRTWELSNNNFSRELPNVEFHAVKVSKAELIWQSLQCVVKLRPFAVHRFITNKVKAAFNEQLIQYQPDLLWGNQIEAYPLFELVSDTKKIIDLVDSITAFQELAKLHKNATLRQQLISKLQFNLAKFECKSIQDSDRAIVCSQPNVDHLASLHGDVSNLSIVYNRVADETFNHSSSWQFDENRGCRLLFVGHLRYPPNILSVRYLAREILPILRTKFDRVECIVCGKDGEQLQAELQDVPNLTIKGFVPDLIAEYMNASVIVSPVPYATGVQNKVIEPMALGLPVVMSVQTALANEMRQGIDVVACSTPVGFADAIIKISVDRFIAEQLSTSGSKLVRSRHTRQVQLDSIQQIVSKTLAQEVY